MVDEIQLDVRYEESVPASHEGEELNKTVFTLLSSDLVFASGHLVEINSDGFGLGFIN